MSILIFSVSFLLNYFGCSLKICNGHVPLRVRKLGNENNIVSVLFKSEQVFFFFFLTL